MNTNSQTQPWKMALFSILPGLLIYSLVCLLLGNVPSINMLKITLDSQWITINWPAVNIPFVYYLPYNLVLMLAAVVLITAAYTKYSPTLGVIIAALAFIFGIGLSLITSAGFGTTIATLLGLGCTFVAGIIIGAMENIEFRSHVTGQITAYVAVMYAGLAIGAMVAVFINAGLAAGIAIVVLNIIIGAVFGWVAVLLSSLAHETQYE
jgi:hypothetical protein